jgi:O-antigen ligase
MGVTRSIKRESFGRYILAAYLAAADLIGIAALYDIFTGGIAAFHDKKEISAIFFNGNHYGYFLLMAILIGIAYYLFSNGRLAVFGAASAALNLALLAVNHSLGSILALIIVLVCTGLLILIKDRVYLKKFGILVAAAVALFVAALLISPALRKEFTVLAADIAAILNNSADGSAGHRRLQMWTLTAGYISEKPLLGYGCEGIAFMLYEVMKVSDPHCEALAYAAYYGIPAALLYVAGVTGVLLTGIRRMESNGVQQKAACMAAAGYFISSFVGVGMFYTLPFFFIFLGLCLKRT